jgi:3-hydroxybutyryl-CoA dehydrogenase
MGDIQSALVVGAGTMGHGFAQIFAMNEVNVALVDVSEALLDRANGWIRDNLAYMTELGEIESREVHQILGRIHFGTDLTEFAKRADFITEAVNEDLKLKKAVFTQIEVAVTRDVIVATNTSSFDINELSASMIHPERFIGAHWFHPPQITPCVEIIPSTRTSPETIERTMAFMVRLGKVPTICKSAPGFVANRIQFAMAAEALAMVDEGLATPQEIDRIVKSSFGFRLGAYGPFEIMDQAGLDTYRAIFEYLFGKLRREQFKPSPTLDKLMAQKRCGLKTQSGFYNYQDGAAEVTKRDRDRKFYARLRLFRDEQGGENNK